ncbi:hypothetical protein ACWEPL_12350 [Nonomuraea sp. NPDC004186]
MTRWIRGYSAENDIWSYYELTDDEWAARQVDLYGPDREPITAAALDEVLRLRDHHDLVALQNYEGRYGVLADGSLEGWQDAEQVTEISRDEFENVWAAARSYLAGES